MMINIYLISSRLYVLIHKFRYIDNLSDLLDLELR